MRIETTSRTLYTFDELSDTAKEKAREWLREAQAGDNWFSESIVEDAKVCLSFLGFHVDNVYWSGFCSQGDGACFVGTWSAADVEPVKALKAHAPLDKDLRALSVTLNKVKRADREGYASFAHRGNYCHEMTVSLSNQDFRRDKHADTVLEAARDAMRWIYRNLERGYEYTMSDEAIDESIRANEYEFDADGAR